MTNYGTPVPMQFLTDVNDIPENLLAGYELEGYSLDFDATVSGRWFHIYTEDGHSGVVWTDDDERCGVIALRRPDFDPASFTSTALALRVLHEAGMSATDAFNILSAAADITDVSVGELGMIDDEIVT